MKKMLLSLFIFCSTIVYSQTWRETSTIGGDSIEWSVITSEQFERLVRQGEEDGRMCSILYTDAIFVDRVKILSGTRPNLRGYYYLLGKLQNLERRFTVIAYGNTNTGRMTIDYAGFNTIIRAGSSQYNRLYNQYLHRVNGTSPTSSQSSQSGSAKELLEQGIQKAKANNFNEAIKDLTLSIQLDPNVKAYQWRGIAYQGLRQYDKVILDYTKVIEFLPDNAEYFFLRGFAYHQTKQYNKAIADLTEAIRLNPNHAKAYNERGVIYGNYYEDDNRAIADFEKAVRLEPNNAKYRENLKISRESRRRSR